MSGTAPDRFYVWPIKGSGEPARALYAERWRPAVPKAPWPVVMIHGGLQTGHCYTATPDGRTGWAQRFVEAGHPVVVVDQPGCGRAPYHAEYGERRWPTTSFVQRRFTDPGSHGEWPAARLHTQWPGTGRSGDAAFDQFMASQQPTLADFALQQALTRDALVALLDRIGPSVLLAHSRGGASLWPVAQARPDLVKAILAIEPSGPPVHQVDNVGPPDWTREATAVRPSGLCELPLSYDPPLAEDEVLAFERSKVDEDGARVAGWLQSEPARRLVALDRIPTLMVVAEASYHTTYAHCTAAYLRQAGLTLDVVHLAERGIRGNGHLMMVERNSDEIADVLIDWLDRFEPKGTRAC